MYTKFLDKVGKALMIIRKRLGYVAESSSKARYNAWKAKSQKGEKLRIIKFKRKNRYTRTIGFRQRQTVLKIKKVEFNG